MATTVSLKPNAVEISGSTSGTTTLQATAVAGTTTLTLPAATDTLVGKATTDTLTNKTLTSPTITGGALNGTVGATTPATGAFTTLSATGVTTVQAGTAAAPAITTTGDTNTGIFFPAADTVAIATSGAEAARIDSSGNLLVGATSGTNHIIYKNAAVAARIIAFQGENSGAYTSVAWATADNQGWNGANTVQIIGKNTGTGRSINAAGTINASGADYAEYMTKAGNFTVAKGDVVGINAQGKLTNVFANAISFVVKSSDPSYVGGDSWGVGFEDDAVGLEAARQLVDRIAFAGQVPVNVTGATAGQYIIPVNDNGAIKGEAVSNPTFEQYQTAVGKVIAIESDGRARIIVKVA